MDAEMEISQPPENEQFSGEDIAAEILVRFQNSPQEEHHNICATVGAISQALKEQGLALTPVAYFAAAVSSFIRLSDDPCTAGGDPDVSALLSFISIILPRVPPAVRKSKDAIFSESLVRVLGCGSLPVSGRIAALKCISHILVVSDKSNCSIVSQLYGILLNCVTDDNSKLYECLGSALAAMGPEKFLCLLPLNLEAEDVTDGNVWVLPILKQYTVGAELHFFSHHILEKIKFLKQKSLKLEREGRIFSARNIKGLIYSLWSLFPSFCNYPVDTNTSFKEIEDILCSTLRQESEFHGIICSGLQILIQQNKSASQETFCISDEEPSFPMFSWKCQMIVVDACSLPSICLPLYQIDQP